MNTATDSLAHSLEDSARSAEATPPAPPTVIRGTAMADLAAIYRPEVMLVSVPMAPDDGALLHARALADAGPRERTVSVSTPECAPDPEVLGRLAMRDEPGATAWVSYLERLTGLFARLFETRAVGLRQIVADGPHCRRFHVDKVLARGIVNVLGACTEWLDDRDVDRSLLGHGGGADDGSSGLVQDWNRLRQSEAGSLAIFKGIAWPEAAERAVVHRSPPADGERRLLLTLDWLE